MYSHDTYEIIDSINFEAPEERENYRIARTKKRIYIDAIDVKITNATKLKVGYMISLRLDTLARKTLKDIDSVSIMHLMMNNKEWFNNELSDEEIKDMFYCSYCEQTNTLKAYIRNVQGIQVFLNNRPIELSEFIESCGKTDRQSMTNVKLQLLGMYVYKKQTINKWCINTINVYDNTDDMATESKEEIEEFWGEMVSRCDETLKKRIENLEANRKELAYNFSDIVLTRGTNEWEAKIVGLKKLIQNIIFY